jgi:hypothetical protein
MRDKDEKKGEKLKENGKRDKEKNVIYTKK